MDIALLLALSLVLIVGGAELFTNAIEWAGYLLHLGEGATGSLLAALGTSLPETIVPIVALVVHRPHSGSIAIGAVLGSSFMLLSLGAGITGAAVLLRTKRPILSLARTQSRRDLGVFLIAFTGSFISIWLPRIEHVIWGIVLVIVYIAYVRLTLQEGAPSETMPEPLHITFHHPERPHVALVILQLIVSVALLIVGSDVFVAQVGTIATDVHLNALLVALIIIPLATELPETLNSVLWIRTNADGLAFGNVAGSATFQSCILGAIAVLFTPWNPSEPGIIGAVLTIGIAAILLGLLWNGTRRGWIVMLAALPWVGFVTGTIATSIVH
ncbi:MAG: sodium:calcium antiporter [Candidatus Dormibacteria bacterium]